MEVGGGDWAAEEEEEEGDYYVCSFFMVGVGHGWVGR